MDGMFVPALSYGMCVVESIRKSCDMVLDVHLMIVEPGRHVEAFAKSRRRYYYDPSGSLCRRA